ncbi:hypothetical protein SynSYN20_01342 [Synechococcus sp. SYN20]|nr:hypothetical protein SynSYN20_01342 [Synechococcus sp. SYN20]
MRWQFAKRNKGQSIREIRQSNCPIGMHSATAIQIRVGLCQSEETLVIAGPLSALCLFKQLF